MRSQLHQYIAKYDGNFMFSLVGTVHTAIAIFVHGILRDPSSGSKNGLNLSFIQFALQNNTFMNTYAMPIVSGDKEVKGTDSPAVASVSFNSWRIGTFDLVVASDKRHRVRIHERVVLESGLDER